MLKLFENYLTNIKKISDKSLKHYKSDINQFVLWMSNSIKKYGVYISSLEEIVPYLKKDTGEIYLNNLKQLEVPKKTINRKLSSLRHLSSFLFENSYLSFQFMQNTQNVSLKAKKEDKTDVIIERFEAFLLEQKVSHNTSKNYTADVRQYFSWLRQNKQQSNQTKN